MKSNRMALFVLLLIAQLSLTLVALSQEAEVVFFDAKGGNSSEVIWIRKACDLLGVRLLERQIGELNDPSFSYSMSALNSRETAILTDRSINGLSQKQMSQLKGDIRDKKVLVLVTGSDPSNTGNSAAALNFWSENGIGKIQRLEADSGAASVRVVPNDAISRELGGFEYPLRVSASGPVVYFELQDPAKAESLIEVAGMPSQQRLPIFLRTGETGKNVFFLAPWEGLITGEKEDLIRLLPLLMFLKFSFREWTWHGLDDLANLTIDDPWLREPYGYISFRELCQEAEKTPFHATISFVPYNYRRSHDDAIEIFRRCRQNLSVAVHGNDHDFSEFRPAKAQKPSGQGPGVVSPNEKSVLQALYRMDLFSRGTGIPYDRVMIFPRANYNEESLGLLKKHNFLMTVNWGGPSRSEYSRDHVDYLREISLEFKNFPVLRRFQIRNWRSDEPFLAEAKRWIQLRLFLDLPVLLYTHHDYFKAGAQAFNSMAGLINTLQPRVEWSGLGAIAKKLYLRKRTGNSKMEILSFSSDIRIENDQPVPVEVLIRKPEDFQIPIASVQVDGIDHAYRRDGNDIRIETSIGPGSRKDVRILYYSDYQVGSFSYSDKGLKDRIIRSLTDFKDIHLTRLPFGDKLLSGFYRIGGVRGALILGIGLVGLLGMILCIRLRRRASKRRGSRTL